MYKNETTNDSSVRRVRAMTEATTMHFDLRHIGPGKQYQFHVGTDRYEVKRHTPATLDYFRNLNPALAALTDDQLQAVTHFAEGVRLPSKVAQLVYVTYELEKPPTYLPGLALLAIHIPADALRRNRQKQLDETGKICDPRLDDLKLSAGISEAETLDILDGLDQYKTPREAAIGVVFQHPQLATSNKDTAAVIHSHIIEARGLDELADTIASQGQNGWTQTVNSTDKNGNELKWGPLWSRAGQPVAQYRLTDETLAKVGVPVKDACQTTQDDLSLKRASWHTLQGTPNHGFHTSAAPVARQTRDAGLSFTINNRTPGHGLEIDASSIEFELGPTSDQPGSFSIDVKNSYLRILGAYVQYLDSQGNSLDPDGTPITGDNPFNFIDFVAAVDVIMGIPLPSDPTTLTFPWPEKATSVNLAHGGLGTSLWNTDVDLAAGLLTGVFQYAVPILFMVAGAEIEDSAWYEDFIKDKPLREIVLKLALDTVGGTVASGPALPNVQSIMLSLADAVAGMLVSKGMEELAEYVTEHIAEAAAEDAIPFVDIAFAVANRLLDLRNIVETTVEVLSSPATYTAEIKRQFALQATVNPDPIKGTVSVKPTWPEVSDHFVFQVQYKNGTNFSLTGEMPKVTSSDPIIGTFSELPAGGKLQVKFAVYSKNNFLAGQWTSGWMDALPPDEGGPLTVEGAIQENLIPLTPDTRYSFKQSLVFDGQANKHVWSSNAQPQEVNTSLDDSNVGNNLAKTVNIALNDKAFMLGYCWEASGQNLPVGGDTNPTNNQVFAFQNINTGANPEDSLKFPAVGFDDQPYIVYDQFGPAPLLSLPSTARTDLDEGILTSDIRAQYQANGYTLATDATVTVVTASAEWTIGWPNQTDPGYVLRRNPNAIEVHAFPFAPFSPNNFYVDLRGSDYQLRQVVLDNMTPFDLNDSKSFGKFQKTDIDILSSVVVHPAGYVIGVNFTNHKMEIVKLPDKGVPDQDAPPSVVVSGKGVRDGLMQGPIAVAVAADGRILVLEATNQRIQAFDLNGNAAPTFDGAAICSLAPTGFADDLNSGHATAQLRRQFEQNGVVLSSKWIIKDGDTRYTIQLVGDALEVRRNGATLSTQWRITDTGGQYFVRLENGQLIVSTPDGRGFKLDPAAQAALERGAVDKATVKSFSQNGIALSAQAKVVGNGLLLDPAQFAPDLALGVISSALIQAFATRNAILSNKATITDAIAVTVKRKDALWIVSDSLESESYKIALDDKTKQLDVVHYEPVMSLKDPQCKTYLLMLTELKGYIYVLSFAGDGSSPDDYLLDIYEPTGAFLCQTRGVNAAQMVVSMWRSVYTLNYQHILGPGGRTEPSVSEWIPSTPGGPSPRGNELSTTRQSSNPGGAGVGPSN